MKPSLTLTHRGIILVLVPLLIGLTSLAIQGDLLRQAEAELSHSYRSREISALAESIARQFSDAGTAIGGYADTSNVVYKDRYASISSHIQGDVAKLYKAIGNDPNQVAIVQKLDQLTKDAQAKWRQDWKELDQSNQVMRRYLSPGINLRGQKLSDSVQTEATNLIKQQQYSESGPDVENRSRDRLKTFSIAIVIVNILFSLVLAWFFSHSIGKRVKVVTDNSLRLASGQDLQPEMQGNDEIAQLDQSFHAMSLQLIEMSRRERAIIENAVDVICSIDSDWKFVAVSPSVQSWGYTQADLLGSRFVNIIEATWVDETLKTMSSVRETKSPLSFENAVVCKDGTIVAALWTGAWSDLDQALFCVVHDLTEQKKLERLRDEFLAMITHDLRTPLTAVQIFHELLSLEVLGTLNQEGLASLSQAEKSVNRLLNMVSDLLDYEKLKAGEMQLVFKPTSLSSILEESVHAVKPFAEKHKIGLELPSTAIQFNADGERLVRVLVNLLSNAVKFSPEGSLVKITLEEDDDWIKLAVVDSGAGIPIEAQSSVFEKYKQVTGVKSSKMQGTGLGLPICKAIVEAHGGSISVSSEVGKGSKFWFQLPKNTVIPESTKDS